MNSDLQREVWEMLDRDHLMEVARKGPEPIFATISGAHLYGFASPDSDVDLRGAFRLPEIGFRIISAVGGRATASTLLQQGLVSDLYLTISPVPGGEPDTRLNLPSTMPQRLVLAKAGREQEAGVRFEHWELCTKS